MFETNIIGNKNIIDVVKYRWVWLSLSILLVIPGLIAMVYSAVTYPTHAPVRVGIDFVGGTVSQYSTSQTVDNASVSDLRGKLAQAGIKEASIQIVNMVNTKDKDVGKIISIRTEFISENSDMGDKLANVVKADYPDAKLVSVSSVGPTLGTELLKNSIYAIALAFLGIVVYLTIRFQLDFALVALLSLVHDALFVIGAFSIMGIFWGVQVDSLFITAVLTVIGFSVHDTIVVFDRIRENSRFLAKKANFNEIVNASVNQTLARSINTSLTTLITLTALYIFGGVTTKDFVLAMILGIAIGTYSSIFFASMLIAWYREKLEPKKAKA